MCKNAVKVIGVDFFSSFLIYKVSWRSEITHACYYQMDSNIFERYWGIFRRRSLKLTKMCKNAVKVIDVNSFCLGIGVNSFYFGF
jgi:hypothetical protein